MFAFAVAVDIGLVPLLFVFFKTAALGTVLPGVYEQDVEEVSQCPKY